MPAAPDVPLPESAVSPAVAAAGVAGAVLSGGVGGVVVEEIAPVPARLPAAAGVGPRRGWSEATIFYALGNQHRRAMFYHIVREVEGLTIEQMAARVRRKRSVTGKHLEILRRTEMVVVERRGQAAVHRLHPVLRAQPDAPARLDFGFMTLQIPGV